MGGKKVFKWVLLFLMVGLPVGIYLFLQAFGENKFEIPVYFQNGYDSINGNCESLPENYFVPVFTGGHPTSAEQRNSIRVYQIATSKCEECNLMLNNIKSIQDRLSQTGFQYIIFKSDTVEFPNDRINNIIIISAKSSEIETYARCQLMLDSQIEGEQNQINRHIILLDKQSRIRGYYDLYDLMDVDRLVTEMTILLQID